MRKGPSAATVVVVHAITAATEDPATYDTVSGVLRQPPNRVTDERLWTKERSSVDGDGVIHRTRYLNLASGLHLTLHDGGALQAERSLPKALRGENVTDLVAGEEVAALAAVDREIADGLGEGLPPFESWLPNRVDYCQNVHLRDEAEVIRTLEKYAGIELPRKGLPVRGQEHSVTWSHGAIRPKVYSKFLETRGDPRACGVLRFESGVIRARSFLQLLPPLTDLTVGAVLTPALHAAVLGRYVSYLRGDLMTTKELSDLDFMRELLSFFGPQTAARLVGWCSVFYVMGVRNRKDMLGSPLGHLGTRYRVAAELRRFREYLVGKGLMDATVETEDVAVDDLLVRIGALGKAA